MSDKDAKDAAGMVADEFDAVIPVSGGEHVAVRRETSSNGGLRRSG